MSTARQDPVIRNASERERREEVLREAARQHRLRANSQFGRRAAALRAAAALRLAASSRRSSAG